MLLWRTVVVHSLLSDPLNKRSAIAARMHQVAFGTGPALPIHPLLPAGHPLSPYTRLFSLPALFDSFSPP